MCAVKELQILGVPLSDNDIKSIKKSEEARILKKQKKKRESFDTDLIESDDYFAFIIGYTSGGASYGITWEKWED